MISTGIGKLCIEVTPADKIATISETLCIGCGICVKVNETVAVVDVRYFYTKLEMPL